MVVLERRLALVLLLFLTVCWGIVMLQFGAGEIYWIVGSYALFAIVVVLSAFGRSLSGALQPGLRPLAIGAGVGTVMTLLTYPVYQLGVALVPSLEPVVRGLYRTSHKEHLATALLWVVVILIAEELLFRGAWLAALQRRIGRNAAFAVSVTLYAAAQACTGSFIVGLLALCCGTIWTIERLATGSILASIVSHMIWTPIIILLCPVVG